jgi:hypothetical protein
MGFKKQAKIYTLVWPEDHELHGLMVSVKGLTVEKMLDLTAKATVLTSEDATISQQSDETGKLFKQFAAALVAWNLEDDNGKPVPATYRGIVSLELSFALDLVMTWMEAVASVGNPLPQASSNGHKPQEESLNLEQLSQSLPN